MLRNYILTARRHLLRHWPYMLLNLLGLTVSLTFLLLIGNYVVSQLSVNRTLRHADRQFLLQSRWKQKDMGYEIASLAPFAPTLNQAYPNLIALYYRAYGVNALVSQGQHHAREAVQLGDSTLLTMFGLPLAYGDPATALNAPNAVVLTDEAALKYFGKRDVLRRQLTLQTPGAGKQLLTVTGVLRPLPDNSVTHLLDFAPQLFLSLRTPGFFADETQMRSWESRTIITYLELQPGVEAAQLAGPLRQILTTHASADVRTNLEPYLSPLTTFHLTANEGVVGKTLLTLAVVALFTLLMAVINFVNITIGTSAARVREIGVRKVLGGHKAQLAGQFLTEALLLTLGATLLGLVGHEALRPGLSDVLGALLTPFWAWSVGAGLALGVGIIMLAFLAGAYPALVLARLPTVASLRGSVMATATANATLRRGLLGFQFAVAVALGTGAVLVGRQVALFFEKELGYQKEQLLTISSVPRNWTGAGVATLENACRQLARVPGVANISASYEIPDGSSSGPAMIHRLGQDSTQAITATTQTVDEHYARTYGLRVVEGQFFNANGQAYDSLHVVLNQSAVRALGWPNAAGALGQAVRFYGDTYRVSGVVADFHQGPLRDAIGSLVFLQLRKNLIYRYVSIRLQPASGPATVAALETRWRQLFPDAPFDYLFMTDTLRALYQPELRLHRAARLATGLALLIALLGVFGLVSLSVTRRTKEIGIRKVLGASTTGLMTLFLREFVFLLWGAALLTGPLVYYVVNRWLAQFTYRITMSWVPFVAVAAGATLLVAAIVGARVLRTALTSPTKTLRMD